MLRESSCKLALVLGALGALSGVACAQWGLDGSTPVRIPSLEELSRPLPPLREAPPEPVEAGAPLSPFLNDSTLRRGDIVVTPDGAMTYRGGGVFNHRTEDFAPLDLPSARPQGRRDR
jgi:hypothetical protein